MATHGARPARTGWVGWVYFAATVLLLAGIIQVISGLIAFSRSGSTLITPSGLAVEVSYAGVGWSFLITGAVLAATGIGLFGGRTWARAVGIAIATISVLANIAFFAAYPLWSAVVIVLDVLVLYALAAHGREAGRR
ncbi:hypothetical protein A8924_0058 [Saccharopolyspora erythraea NRRL 2338]|uniref:Integral membrane protein n=2 Tax=Saccharopolyspora erythraea TaxID=1836 RepID=A4FQB4_SACEN|nr:hypothetical protein [Saccharopolyspora erythraea]EQD86283.1 membrane protein [Saccharopolyspora erythraea D]PFG92839.1 hypothetical protein A8924_0058 [Saccharopolyspora erythraea NRRL 2338]CAM06239.1 integral membrane protein [Saccharopolyspora erythraea NRRL 2338]